jgi:hypothetical protein
MLWFKHQNGARNDPFVWDLRQRFGPEGYFVYFATLEIYAANFKSEPGWYLDVSIDYLRHELTIYHQKKLKMIIDFIRSWPDIEGGAGRPVLEIEGQKEASPKWIAQLTDKRIALLIPNFIRIMDNYTAQKMRDANGPAVPDTAKAPAESKAHEKIFALFRDIARDCEILAGQPAINGRSFKSGDFVGWCVNNEYHPSAIRDGTAALVQQVGHWEKIQDPWAYARGVVKTRAAFYKREALDFNFIKMIFGKFFKVMQSNEGGNNAQQTGGRQGTFTN